MAAYKSVPLASGGKKARQGHSPADRQFDLRDISRRATAIAAERVAALRATTARLREPRDSPTRAIEATK